MGIQMYLVHPKDNGDDQAREQIAEFIARRAGFILIATSHGSLITAFDEIHLNAVKAHHQVEFASGVTMNPDAPGAKALQNLFAENIAAQLAERGVSSTSQMAPSESEAYPPGYKPMRWTGRT